MPRLRRPNSDRIQNYRNKSTSDFENSRSRRSSSSSSNGSDKEITGAGVWHGPRARRPRRQYSP